ncbi:MAG: aminodeoxychorismate synthase component I [Acidobacteriota bacterium]
MEADSIDGLGPMPSPRVENFRDWVEPTRVLEVIRAMPHPALLLSGLPGHTASRFSILAWSPEKVVTFAAGRVRVDRYFDDGRTREPERIADPFLLLRTIVAANRVEKLPGIPFAGGAIGYLGYGMRHYVESLPSGPPDPVGAHDLWFGIYDAAIVFDHAERRIALVAGGSDAGDRGLRSARATARLLDFRARLEQARDIGDGPPGRAPAGRAGQAVARTPQAEYRRSIERALGYIASGDVYQVNLSHRIQCPFAGDPIDLFLDLARDNPAPFAAYLDTGRIRVISASPERFLSLHGGRASSSPIKGTRPRGATPDQEGRLVEELLGSAKDRAENVMIADLVRNDLGRVCEPGSVHVEKLCALETFATVHHLVSTISGRPRVDRDRIDLMRALFPGGSMTGAPKVRAMEVIDELEREERGIYSGSIGYLSFDGGMDLNIVIRTILCAEGSAHLRVGGGIVADSDPEAEYRETLDKAHALLRALNVRLGSA